MELVDGVGGREDRREHETDKARPQDTQHDTQASHTSLTRCGWWMVIVDSEGGRVGSKVRGWLYIKR